MGIDTDEEHGVPKAEFDEVLTEISKGLESCGFGFAKVDVEKAMPPDLATALKATVPWMRKMAGEAEGDTRKSILRSVAFLSKVSSGAFPAAPPFGQEEDPKKKKKADPMVEEEETGAAGKKTPKTKALSLEDDDELAVLKMNTDGGVSLVTKGRRFTPKRTAALADSAKGILGLLKETDPETFKATMEAIGKELPSDLAWTPGTAATGTGGGKSKAEDAEKAGIKKSIDDFGTRLEAIEKARAPSKSVEGDGGTDKKETKKSFWEGVL